MHMILKLQSSALYTQWQGSESCNLCGVLCTVNFNFLLIGILQHFVGSIFMDAREYWSKP